MQLFGEIKNALLHLAFPHVCEACGRDLPELKQMLCLRCLSSLPATNFHMYPNNPIEKVFWGRLPVTYASSQFYFTRESLVQQLMHQFKYKGNKELGLFLGKLMGLSLRKTSRFDGVDALIPLPLYIRKEKRRGYNQAMIIAKAIADIMNKTVYEHAVIRSIFTETQTQKNVTSHK